MLIKKIGSKVTPTKTEELIGRYSSTRYRSEDGTFMIGSLATKDVVIGQAPSGGLVEGLDYRFLGKWETSDYGQQFRFIAAVQHTPSTRHGVVQYLKKYAPGIGDATAHALCDAFGADEAIGVLKTDPAKAADKCRGLTIEKARNAAAALVIVQQYQETHVRLLDLIGGRGFGQAAIEACIKHWGVHAPDVVRRDPFKLMVKRVPGAGFLRCDQLWHAFGLPIDRLKRQVMAVWYHLRSDMSGSTWHDKAAVIETVKALITGTARPDRAIAIAIRAKRIVQEEWDGRLWVAEASKADDERTVSERLKVLA